MDVGPQGRMGVFQDPSGAVIGAWQPGAMAGFSASGAGSFGWPELSARGVERAIAFYREVFGWSARTSPMGEGQPDYTEFLLDGESIAGGQEMQPMVPAQVPSYWLPYFTVADVDALGLGPRSGRPGESRRWTSRAAGSPSCRIRKGRRWAAQDGAAAGVAFGLLKTARGRGSVRAAERRRRGRGSVRAAQDGAAAGVAFGLLKTAPRQGSVRARIQIISGDRV